MDLTSAFMLIGMFLSLVVGEAALFGSTLQVSISVPPEVSRTGFTAETAEQVFVAETGRIGQTHSLIPPPVIQTTGHPGVLSSLAKPLKLDPAVAAVQQLVGLHATTVAGSIIVSSPAPALEMIATVTVPREATYKLALSQPDGNPTALVEEMARRVSEDVLPYRVALAEFTRAIHGDSAARQRAKQTVARTLAKPWDPLMATQRVMMLNLAAMIALLEGDQAEAERQLIRSEPVPDAEPMAHGAVAINRAFLAVANRHPAEARAFYQAGRRLTSRIPLPKFQREVDLLEALVLWSDGDRDRAETILRAVIKAMPDCDEARFYLGDLLASLGRTAEADEQYRVAAVVRRFDTLVGTLAHTLFRVDPVNGGLTRFP
ncbi:MAG: tetratricopeptide repeat protein [Acetobacteraceae bacterium]